MFYKIPLPSQLNETWREKEHINRWQIDYFEEINSTYSNNTINWLGVPSRIIRICCNVEWHGATKFNRSWQFNVAGTDKRHKVFDKPSAISVRSLRIKRKSKEKMYTIYKGVILSKTGSGKRACFSK